MIGSLSSLLFALSFGAPSPGEDGPGAAKDSERVVEFNRDVRPVLSRHCFACHGPDEGHRKAGLRLDREEAARAERERGRPALVPGDVEGSEMWARVITEDEGDRMPPPSTGHTVTDEEREILRRWIEQGAAYAEHWAWIPPRRTAPPAHEGGWVRDPLDAFVLERMRAHGLEPNPEADRATLLRRWSLDLTGLPPTPAEVRAFVEDPSPDAAEKVVDRLLASPAYSERWTRVWLDLARYADSAGYGSDPLRTIWRYRDWVIEAFDRNLPFDRFTVEQLAGDLLPDASVDQRLATAFHRNTMTNTEGGTDDEEFRVEAVKDRVHTTMQTWMGLTANCAQCHSHKFDPISHREYYQLFAFFDQTEDRDLPGEAPRLDTPSYEQRESLARLDAQQAEIDARLRDPGPEIEDARRRWVAGLDAEEAAFAPLVVRELVSEAGADLRTLEDGSVLADGLLPETDTYRVRAELPTQPLTALRLEVLPDQRLPAGGPGRGNGNFVLGSLELALVSPGGGVPEGRRVRLSLDGPGRILSLAEVEVVRGGENVARGGTARQSSVAYDGQAGRAIDGNPDGVYEHDSVTHTETEADPWWEVTLAQTGPIERIVVHNRIGASLPRRLDGVRIEVRDEAGRVVWATRWDSAPDTFGAVEPGRDGHRVRVLAATADFSQEGWEVGLALNADVAKGWAVSPRLGVAHQAVFELEWPEVVPPDALLQVTLRQGYGSGHSLGRWRLSTSARTPAPRAHPAEVLAAARVPEADRSPEQQRLVREYHARFAPELQDLRERLVQLKTERDALKPVSTPVMRELPADRRRTTHLLVLGNFLQKGEVVQAEVPAAFPPLPAGVERDRLALARWLVDPDNPLTARVTVNRFWARMFGRGLVETEEDFGTQGSPPTHPRLLDTLALDFVQGGWDVKALLRRLALSATYRQSSTVHPESLEKDPGNRWLARSSRRRLEAEMVRDQALALAGLLSARRFGPSVFPPQPPGMWQAAFNGQRNWNTSTGEDRYRRGLYTFWRRTVPYPSMATFDAPSREICAVRRIATNTPLQAFVTLNDPVYVEAAQALGRRLMHEGGETPAQRARFGLQLCTAQTPADAEVEVLVRLHEQELAHARAHAAEAVELATEPLGPLPEGWDPAEAAAWTVVANVLLNLDEVLSRG